MSILKDGTLVSASNDGKIWFWKAKNKINAG